jgi:hypothetical protein
MDLENVLAKIRGADIAAAIRTLPAAQTDTVDERSAEMTVPDLGLVRFYFRRLTAKTGKSRRFFWCAKRAVVVESISSM